MAASPLTMEGVQPPGNWGPPGDQDMGPAGGDDDPSNGTGPLAATDRRTAQDPENPEYPRGSSVGDVSHSGSKNDASYREKQVKPNKVYVGGLPEHTRQEDLQSCFGKIGAITNIELKVGYGFVEFDSREAAEESVAKYHEGFFMGNKIRVELSHGGGRTAKYSGDPGACFKCGQMGHWARECPNHTGGGRRSGRDHHANDAPLIDRIQPSRDYPPTPRDFPYRDDFGPGRYPPPRDLRYAYDYPPPPPPGRDFRRPLSPPREFRDYPAGPPSMRSARDYDDYRIRGPPPPPIHRYDSRPGYYPPDAEGPPPGYPPRGYGPPPPLPPRDPYDRYDRRPPPTGERYPSYPPPPLGVRLRTPPGGPTPRGRDEFDRGPPPPREYPPTAEFRGRPASPPSRYPVDYRPGSPPPSGQRYRRRSGSPPPRPSDTPYDPAYPGGVNGGFPGNGYSGGPGAPSASGPPPRSGGSRDYPPPPRGRDTGEPGSSYRRV